MINAIKELEEKSRTQLLERFNPVFVNTVPLQK